jgi:hypothetical protein
MLDVSTRHPKPTVRRVTRADEAFEASLAKTKRDEEATAFRYATEYGQSQVRAQAERMSVVNEWPAYRSAVGWFKREWQGALPRALHIAGAVEPEDAYGAPALTDRWRSYLYGQVGSGDTPEPIRAAMGAMAVSGNRYERCAAAFLFVMACMDFDAGKAGLHVSRHCLCEPERDESGRFLTPHANTRACVMRILPLSPEYAPYYAQQAIERLRERVVMVEGRPQRALPEPEWKSRLQIGKSDAQYAAEASAG